METTYDENLKIGEAAKLYLEAQRKLIARQEDWIQRVDHPANSVFNRLTRAYNVSPGDVKKVIFEEISALRTAAVEGKDQTAQLVLLEVRNKFEKANIHPPSAFPYLDWEERKKK